MFITLLMGGVERVVVLRWPTGPAAGRLHLDKRARRADKTADPVSAETAAVGKPVRKPGVILRDCAITLVALYTDLQGLYVTLPPPGGRRLP